MAKTKDAEGNDAGTFPVTIDEIHVLKKGSMGLYIGTKGGYFFAVFADTSNAQQQGPAALAAMAIGFCALRRQGRARAARPTASNAPTDFPPADWCVGPDAA